MDKIYNIKGAPSKRLRYLFASLQNNSDNWLKKASKIVDLISEENLNLRCEGEKFVDQISKKTGVSYTWLEKNEGIFLAENEEEKLFKCSQKSEQIYQFTMNLLQLPQEMYISAKLIPSGDRVHWLLKKLHQYRLDIENHFNPIKSVTVHKCHLYLLTEVARVAYKLNCLIELRLAYRSYLELDFNNINDEQLYKISKYYPPI